MLIRGGSDNGSRHERKVDNINGFYYGARGYSIHDYKQKNVNVLNVVSYILGVPLSVWAAWLYIGGWKGTLIWILAGAFWLVKLIRACIKVYFEYKEKQIELREKESRYDKDIFT